jgi:isoleucyl-tRNA synthetase
LHAISTLLNESGKVPTGYAFKNVICLGHILDAKGKKMSKSKGNVIEPMKVMDEYGADMLRWMLFTINQPGLPKKFDIKNMKDIMNRVFRMLWNSYSFFVMYANIDKLEIKNEKLKVENINNLLDKWIVSEMQTLIKNVDEKLEAYDIYSSAKSIEVFVDNLSNWYIRRSRKRFWKSENDTDKNEAYATLHYVLVELSKLMAPFTPFIAEEIFRNLTGKESVHLADFPVAHKELIDEKLNEEMEFTRVVITQALQDRAKSGIKVRQPLFKLDVHVPESTNLRDEMQEIIKDEVNVKEVIRHFILKAEAGEFNIKTGNASFEIKLDINITPELKLEGQAREVIRFVQEMRKEAGYEIDNRILVSCSGKDAGKILIDFESLIAKEILSDKITQTDLVEYDIVKKIIIEDNELTISLKKI